MAKSKLKTNNLKGQRVARYARCSSDEQARGEFTTVEAQDEATLAHVMSVGSTDAGLYADDGKTGTNLLRPGWRRLLRDAQLGDFDAVVCTYLERLGRGNVSAVAEYLLKEAGVKVFYLRETFGDGDASRDMGEFVQKEGQRFASGLYAASVRKWTLDKMAQMFDKGFFVGGGVGYGYLSVPAMDAPKDDDLRPPKVRVPDPETAPLVAKAFDIFLTTQRAPDAREYLETATGRAWTHKQVMYMLRNRTYAGEARWRDKINPTAHPALVSPDVFEAVQAALLGMPKGRKTRAEVPDAASPYAYYLRGRVFCGCCSQENGDPYRMTSKDATGRNNPVRYYECIRHFRYNEHKCFVKRVNANRLHEAIVTELTQMSLHPWRVRMHIERAAAKMIPSTGITDELKAAERRLTEVDKKLDKMTEAIAVGGAAVVRVIAAKIASLDAERTAMVTEVQRLKSVKASRSAWKPNADVLMETLSLFGQIWERRTDEEKTQLLSCVVDRVVLPSRTIAQVTLLPVFGNQLRLDPRELGGYEKLGANDGA